MVFKIQLEVDDMACETLVETEDQPEKHILDDTLDMLFLKIKLYVTKQLEKEGLKSS